MDDSRTRRYQYLFDRSNDIFNRLEDNITSLNSQNATFIGIVLGITSIIIGILLFLLQDGWMPSTFGKLVFVMYFLLNMIIIAMNLLILKPTEYEDLNVFEKSRFNELLKMDEETLYSDFLYHIKKAYKFNLNKYNTKVEIFKWSLYLFSLSTALLIMIILGNVYGW